MESCQSDDRVEGGAADVLEQCDPVVVAMPDSARQVLGGELVLSEGVGPAELVQAFGIDPECLGQAGLQHVRVEPVRADFV